MDAIDAVLVDFDVTPLAIVATNATAFEPALKSRIASLMEFAERVWLDEIGPHARRTLAGLPSSAGRVTGAEGARILGGVYRHA